jgi:sugar (pentulose or hexulose) kinase
VFFPYRGAVARVNPEERLTRATGSNLWVQIHSDVANVPISLTRVGDAPALGSAILAVVGAGIFPDVREATHEMVHVERQIEPDQSRHDEYRFYVDKYVEAYPRMRELMHETVRHVASGSRPVVARRKRRP